MPRRTIIAPWEYFEKELANADHTAISLRPFINTLDNNAVDIALSRTEKYVRNGIIPCEIYASKAVRDDTTENYFADLTQDAFSKDLLRFKEVIRTAEGEKFRFKSLSESQFEELISTTYSKIEDSEVVKSSVDLKRLIFANGIMAEKTTTKGRYYRFAPIYWYSWGLVNSVLENEEKKKPNKNKKKPVNLIDNKEYEGIVVEIKMPNGKIKKRIQCQDSSEPLHGGPLFNFISGDVVSFIAKNRPAKNDSKELYWYADKVHLKV